jgi:pimeloyl-ACP methyl ester carboxylesterase
MHGVGGLFAYIKLIKGLKLFGCPVIALELPYVSLHIAPDVPTVDEHAAAFRQILDENGFEGAILIGHSFGTKVMSWLIQAEPTRVAGAVFLDPVVFMLHLSDVVYSWFYEAENRAEEAWHSLGDVMGIVKTELFAVHAVQRRCVWFSTVLWAHELQERGIESLVLVSSEDKIVPSAEVSRHITEHGESMRSAGERSHVAVEMLELAQHGSLVFEDALRADVLQKIGLTIDRCCKNWAEKRL